MNHDIRQIVANRLRSEVKRKKVESTSIVSADLSQEVVDGYLRGTRELRWSEFVGICRAIDADPMWLLSADYQSSHLVYRNASAKARGEAARIENTFLSMHKAFPTRASRPGRPSPLGDSPAELLTRLSPIVCEFRKKYGSVQKLYKEHGLPVLGVHVKNDSAFDAFLVACQKNYLVCVNLRVPDVRIEFSLLHEFAHFIFDADQDIPIDIEITGADLYGDEVSKEVKPEYVANKFAQLWLVPFGDAEEMAKAWPDTSACINYIMKHRISPDVVANAVYDVVRFYQNPPRSYAQIRDAIKSEIPQWEGRSEVRKFIEEESRSLRDYLTLYLEDAQEERRTEILSAWGVTAGVG